jgi:eukaryotic-like serine/threonine-protein kinase
MAELEGRTLDRYELLRLIGKGGMANVYEAYDPKIQRTVAIKVFKRDDEEMLRRFIREANLMATLRHPHLVEIYDTGESPIDGITRYYIVMPLLTGGTLRTRVRRSPLELAAVCQCLQDIGGALDYIHSQGIIHRDIKASNVLLNDEGRCYLTDFGIARNTTDSTQLTSTGNVLGTVDYVAPELFEVHQKADALSDLYSLGVLLYEMVTGRLPFSADNQLALISMHVGKAPPSPRQFAPQLPANVESVIFKALEKKPALRYATATALAKAFCLAVSQNGISVPGFSKTAKGLEEAEPTQPVYAPPASTERQASDTPRVRPSPLDIATEGLALGPQKPQKQVVLSGAPLTPTLPPRPIQQPRRNRALLLIILTLAALLILLIPVTYVALTHQTGSSTPASSTATTASSKGSSPTPTPATTQTAQALATANAHATATAVAAPTATAQAQATATTGPIGTATSGQPAYQDSLTDGNSANTQAANWDQSSQCAFQSDGYHIQQSASFPYFKGCREQNNSYGNLALSVNVKLLSGHSGGVYFRLGTNLIGNYDGYLFEIDSQGNYKISRQQGTNITALPDHDWKPSPALHTGYNQTNLLQLIARGDTLQFYANGSFLTKAQNSFYEQGTIGFLASTTSGGNDAEVVYSGLKIYALQ